MDFSTLFESLTESLGGALPKILGALAILVVGWLIAVVIRAIVRKSLGLVRLNQRIKNGADGAPDLEGGIARGAFYIVLLIVMVAFFNMLGLALAAAPLQSLVEQILGYMPSLIAGGVLILIAWILATVLSRAATRLLAATSLDEKLSAEADMKPMSDSLGKVLYGLVLLLFLPAVLGALRLDGLLEPIQGMIDKMLNMLPNVVVAAVLGIAGWFVARLLRDLVGNLLAAAGADKLGERAGLKGTMSLSRLVGLVVFIFTFVPTLIVALDTLKLEAISRPATEMLGAFMNAVPNLLAAAAILAVAFFVSKFVGNLIATLLGGMGFDELPRKLGLKAAFTDGGMPSRLVGKVIVFYVMLFATVEAANVIGFTRMSDIVALLIEFGGQVLLGVVIIAAGLWLSNLAHAAIGRLDRPNSAFMAGLARFAILGIVLAMGLRSMGIADDIVNLAFALTLGAVAVAVALSFGLGGREAAGRQMEHWLGRLRGER